jgi:oligopeptide transport system permease protein
MKQQDSVDLIQKESAGGIVAAMTPDPALFVPASLDAGKGLQQINRPPISYWQDAWLRLKRNKMAMASAAFVVVLALLAIFGPFLIEYSHDEQEVWNLHSPPSLGKQAVVVDYSQTRPEIPTLETIVTDATDDQAFEPPPAPPSVELLGDPLTTGVGIQWQSVEGVDGYRIYRSIDASTLGVPLTDTDAATLGYFDQNAIQPGQNYFYSVFSYNSFGDSEEPAVIEVTPKLALSLEAARSFDSNVQIGDTVKTRAHYLGTDYLGRDMLARILSGARISLFIGFAAPLLYILIGIIYGCISGYFGGVIDDIMMRIADIVSTVPELLAVIMLQVFLGSGVFTLILAIVLVAWARSARQIRGEVLRLREAEFVHAAKLLGSPTRKIIFRHLLPNTTGTILVLFTLAIPQAIFTEAFLSFIGLGIKPPLASWGSVTREGAKVFLTYPHELLVPAVVISVSIFAFNLLGDGMRDALDPRLRGSK